MSLKLSDENTLKGIAQVYEQELGYDIGYVTGNTTRYKQFIANVNLTWDDYLDIALKTSGHRQFDDTNHGKLPLIYLDIVNGQQDYSFSVDEEDALILDVYRLAILQSATATVYNELEPVDQHSKQEYDIFAETGITGVPSRYDKIENTIIFDVTFDYNATKGIKIAINREANYFDTSEADKSKFPGCPGGHHEYFAIKAAYREARRRRLDVVDGLETEVFKWEGDEERGYKGKIAKYFSRRSRDERKVMRPRKILYK